MSTCPECAQLLSPEAKKCPSCGHDLYARPLAEQRPSERDEELDSDELLTAAIANEGINQPPPPWVPSLEERFRPARSTPAPLVTDTEVRDVLPEPVKKSFWRRLVRS